MWDSEIICFVYLKNAESPVKLEIMWSYLMNDLLKYLFETYGENWIKAEPFFAGKMNIAYGRLNNDETAKKLIGRKLKKNDFETILKDNPLIDIVLYLKSEPNNPSHYTITKKELIDDFIEDIYNSHAEDWKYFDTYFHDTGEIAYGSVKNDSYRRKNRYLTIYSLYQRRIAINKEILKDEKKNKMEIFYLLKFENKDFIKIGRTFRKFEYRLYNYIYPSSSEEKNKYEGIKIDFINSYVLLTNIDYESFKNFEKQSFENKINKLCIKDRVSKDNREILNISAATKIINEMKKESACKLLSLEEYTGYSNIEEFIKGNENICKKAVQFYKKKQNSYITNNLLK
jgi:hypothetical protein